VKIIAKTEHIADMMKWYDRNHSNFEKLRKKTEGLLEELIDDDGIRIHAITSRVKDKDSLVQKFLSKEGREITDIIGIRIIVNKIEDVKEVCRLIEREFDIDELNSSDKSSELETNEMGYLSVHYVAQMNKSRTDMTENLKYKGIKFEVQVRTILQHAWATISHENIYKSIGSVSSTLERKFYRVASLLETADQALQDILDELFQEEQAILGRQREKRKKEKLEEILKMH